MCWHRWCITETAGLHIQCKTLLQIMTQLSITIWGKQSDKKCFFFFQNTLKNDCACRENRTFMRRIMCCRLKAFAFQRSDGNRPLWLGCLLRGRCLFLLLLPGTVFPTLLRQFCVDDVTAQVLYKDMLHFYLVWLLSNGSSCKIEIPSLLHQWSPASPLTISNGQT